MQAKIRQCGNSFDYTPSGAVAAGGVVVVGSLVGVAERAISAGALGALTIEGLFTVAMAAVQITAGQPAYWDADGSPVGGVALSGAFTNVATGNTFAGFFVADQIATDTEAVVSLMSADATSLTTLSVASLADVGACGYVAGKILVADGAAFQEVALSGDATLAANGAITLALTRKPISFTIADPGTGVAIPVTARA